MVADGRYVINSENTALVRLVFVCYIITILNTVNQL